MRTRQNFFIPKVLGSVDVKSGVAVGKLFKKNISTSNIIMVFND